MANTVTPPFVLALGDQGAISEPISGTSIRLCGTQPCWYKTGANPTPSRSEATWLPADIIESVSITTGDKLAVIGCGSGGNLNVTPRK